MSPTESGFVNCQGKFEEFHICLCVCCTDNKETIMDTWGFLQSTPSYTYIHFMQCDYGLIMLRQGLKYFHQVFSQEEFFLPEDIFLSFPNSHMNQSWMLFLSLVDLGFYTAIALKGQLESNFVLDQAGPCNSLRFLSQRRV